LIYKEFNWADQQLVSSNFIIFYEAWGQTDQFGRKITPQKGEGQIKFAVLGPFPVIKTLKLDGSEATQSHRQRQKPQ